MTDGEVDAGEVDAGGSRRPRPWDRLPRWVRAPIATVVVFLAAHLLLPGRVPWHGVAAQALVPALLIVVGGVVAVVDHVDGRRSARAHPFNTH